MNPHGTYTIEVTGSIIHVYPVGAFNEFGIMSLHKEIRSIMPSDQPWVLIEHPKDKAGLTPEAAETLCQNYCLLSQYGCKAIGLEVNNLWAHTIKKIIGDRLDLPFYVSENADEVEKSVCEHLKA